MFLKLSNEDILQQDQVLGDIPIIKNLTTNKSTQENPSSSMQPPLHKKVYKAHIVLSGDPNHTALILRLESSLGYEWMAQLNGYIISWTYTCYMVMII